MTHHHHAWDKAYTDGSHEKQWDTPWASPELAGFLSVAGSELRDAVDVGCGTGGDAVYLASRGLHTTGVDFSAAALDIARDRSQSAGVEVSWLVGDALDLPLEDASFDLMTDRGCLHHIEPDDQPRYAAEAARVLRPGGILFLRDMCHHGHHKHPITEEAITTMIANLPLRARSIVPYDMVGPSGFSAATLAVIDRV